MPADDWQLRVLWLLMNPVKQSCACLCDRNEGQKERQQGLKLFSYSVSCHTLQRKHNLFFVFFLSAPSPIIAVFCYPDHTLPGEAARQRDWRGTKQILHLHVSHTLLCFSVFAKVGHCHCSSQREPFTNVTAKQLLYLLWWDRLPGALSWDLHFI